MAITRQTPGDSGRDLVRGRPVPGVVVVHSGRVPVVAAIALRRGSVVLGRALAEIAELPDDRISREHAAIELDGDTWRIRDLDSRNGTFVDGHKLTAPCAQAAVTTIRIGNTLALPTRDVRPYVDLATLDDGAMVAGPATRTAFAEVGRAAAGFSTVLVVGDSGTGKELAAAAFHTSGPAATGPFVAMNCAALPEGLAERLLFGAVRGAYSGADETADGFVQAADGGVLFLDEIGELSLALQAKLLRVLEAREVTMLGATRPRRIDLRCCFATHRDLRRESAAGRFRTDLYYRIGRPEVRLAPLRERREEIPWLIARALAEHRLPPHADLVEACLLRPWPGNVRELIRETAIAASAAAAARGEAVRASDLSPGAGLALDAAPARDAIDRTAIEAALAASDGNAAAAARALGLHRGQLYRLMKRFGLR